MNRIVAILILALGFTSGASDRALATPSGFQDHIFNGRNPVTREGVTTFIILAGDCSDRDYGDGRGESNCWNGNVSSRLTARRNMAAGSTVHYAFSFRVDPSFSYRGNRLEIAMWQRINAVKNHMYELELNASRGATFEGRVCVEPNRLSSWNDFLMRVTWRNDATGHLEVICNGEVIYERTGNVLVPEGCGTSRKPQCDPARQRLEQPIQFQLGPLMRGYGGPPFRGSRPSAFEAFQQNGITIKIRDLIQRHM